ncbi:MAG: adenosylcobinamide-GDP ribazoletransferase [Nitrospirae bacterium]|nr:adenosylcobinamide-GDP ribazoletransferase [Nitrospirota bacterium]
MMLKNFITALQFLTIITVRKDHEVEEGDLAKSMVYFPVVGFLIGVLLVNADKIFALIALPQTIATFLLVILSVLITRALHIDGLADTLDGLMGGRDHSSRLAIMKDSRLGTAGALGIVFVLFMKYLCLNNLFESDRIVALLVAPVLARWAQTLMVSNAEYGREHGMGKAFVGHLRSSGMVATSAVAIGLSAFVVVRLDVRSVVLFLVLICGVLLLTYLGKRYLVRKLGGVTGDAIGAMSELNEVLVLFLFVILSSGN